MFRRVRLWLPVAACVALAVTTACDVELPASESDASPTAAPVIEAGPTATRSAPLRIVTPTAVVISTASPTSPGSQPPAENPEVYVVQEGDSLYAIANRFGVELQELIALNNLRDPNDIQAGQELKIPPRE